MRKSRKSRKRRARGRGYGWRDGETADFFFDNAKEKLARNLLPMSQEEIKSEEREKHTVTRGFFPQVIDLGAEIK